MNVLLRAITAGKFWRAMVRVTSYEPIWAMLLELKVNVSPAIVRNGCAGDSE